MILKTKVDILFDDIAVIMKVTGDSQWSNVSLNANCDCAGYISTDEDNDTKNSFRVTTEIH